tara:strand:- start:16383 stop:17207 length:825 start_codon:yes stop_codon:yes gene_type:complete
MADEQVADVSEEVAPSVAETSSDWRSMLPEDIRDHSALSSIHDVPNLAKSFVNAQSMIGRDKIAIPSQHSTPEDWDQVYNKLGRPEGPDKYEMELPENTDEKFVGWYKDTAHKLGLNNAQAQMLANEYDSFMQAHAEANTVDYKAIQSEQFDALKKEFGGKYDENMALGSSIVSEFGEQEMLELPMADGSRLGDRPEFIRAMVSIGEFIKERISEDAFEGIAKGQGGLSPDDITDQLAELEAPNSPIFDPMHPQHREYTERRKRLYEAKYPEGG